MNRTIYMTYKHNVPENVLARWKSINKDYHIELSLDTDCIDFLRTHFNENIVALFKNLKKGMHKADLWRLCKLYIHGGVYADADLVPYIDVSALDSNVTFYSCLSTDPNSVFQAFMVVSKPKSPLLLHYLISFLLNNPSHESYFSRKCFHEEKCRCPTHDMYKCILQNVNHKIEPDKPYAFDEIKIRIHVGPSTSSMKMINLLYFPKDISYTIMGPNRFTFFIQGDTLTIRNKSGTGWTEDLQCYICIKSHEVLLLFPEHGEEGWASSYVSHKGTKILDCRDPIYIQNKGWNARRPLNKKKVFLFVFLLVQFLYLIPLFLSVQEWY